MNRDFFEHKASAYEKDEKRVSNVANIANAIIDCVDLKTDMHLIDFGSGTGLLLERIAPFVKKITAIDISKSMNEQLDKKRDRINCEVDILELDLASTHIEGEYDGIISSMTMHHVKEIVPMFKKFYSLLGEGGVIAISDLDEEDGSFHTEDTGVYHLGFDRQQIMKAAEAANFREVNVTDASVVCKPHGEYPAFLLTAKK